ncbi:MAG: NUDIX domain-containing protein, partial [Bacilli bacterium]|nr:NUDIX domain-containing protein [Bacilli bacterium]
KREIKEETGYIVTSKESFLEIKEYFYWNKNWEHIQHYFICDIVSYENELNLTDREKEEGCTTKWVEIEKAIDIFSSYPSYLSADIATAGLYKRELLALEEYLDLVKKNRKDFKGK